ncbi:P83/100 family protein [Leptospira licerasiae]|uniref:Uncharacterized protein n=1 Tax=Leptospira licerasiae str. MMD4847 TaxID=1049971 RepID=A0ABP2RAA4_9LEPT|nr:P83/100 family protein [Leptospira licerasiae]EIE02751.1 hypothetical protein LEP1GSC185_1560 [Leptospira licerasiae serovar Varillal str. VAR 010]EJZ40265.1 hypothetical protein LEP1GSC178_0821 [Leptospira licerasiae str. MMD4847]
MSRIRLAVFLIFLGSFSFPILAQEGPKLGEKEVRSSGKVNFVNRSAARADEETKGSNARTGAGLSEALKKDPKSAASADGITAIRILPDEKEKKFGADLISIGKDADYGHINSIQRILSGYVKANFGYSEANSDTLATYILYYNAIHRKATDYVKRKYNTEVVKNAQNDKIGIGRRYTEWPGKTQIIIPIVFNVLSDDGKDLDTDELEKEVNKDLDKKKEGQDDKKKMNDLQNEKAEEEKRKLQDKKEENRKKQEDASNKEREAEREIQELNKDPVKNKQKIVQKQEERKQAQQEQQKAKKEEQQLKEKEKEIAKKEESRKSDSKSSSSSSDSKSSSSGDSKKSEAKSDDNKSKEELKQELKETKKELETVKEEQKKKEDFDKNVVGGKILFLKTLKYTSDGHYSNELNALDPTKDDVIFKGDFNKICGRTFEVIDGKALVVGYESDHSAAHKLILIDQETLKPAVWSADSVFWRSPMIIKGEEVYAFEERNGKYYLSRYDKGLKKTAGSEEEISPNSNVTFFGEKIYVTGKEEGSGKTEIAVFSKADLKLIKKIKP